MPFGNLYVAEIYVLPRRLLTELLQNPNINFLELGIKAIHGTLDVDLKHTIGKMQGSFKTAHQGSVRATNPSAEDGFPWQMKLAIKRPYYTNLAEEISSISSSKNRK